MLWWELWFFRRDRRGTRGFTEEEEEEEELCRLRNCCPVHTLSTFSGNFATIYAVEALRWEGILEVVVVN